MIYFLGDSFLFGWNYFHPTVNPNRKQILCSNLLSSRLNQNYKNYSLVGSSNYRLCRLVNFLDIKSDDIVILGWTACDRLEIGVPKDRLMPNDVVVNYDEVDNLDHLHWSKIYQIVEKTNDIYTRSLYPTIIKQESTLTSPGYKTLAKHLYHYASDKTYHEQMFKILFNSSVHKLRNIGCKFLMFTTWDFDLKDTSFLDIPEYLFYKTNMLDEVRYKNSKNKHRQLNDYKYWNDLEHQKVSDILYNNLREKYDIQ
jgi:hypothetical protein